MQLSSLLIGLGLGICSFALTWATARHFTGLAQENTLALAIGIAVGAWWLAAATSSSNRDCSIPACAAKIGSSFRLQTQYCPGTA